jgi:hypothetical protein
MWDKIAEFFSRLLPESFLQDLIDRFTRRLAMRAPGALAKDLLKTALVLIVLGLLVDAWLYWAKKERRALLARRFRKLAAVCRFVWEKIRILGLRIKYLVRKLYLRIRARFVKPDPEAELRAQEEAESFSRLIVLDAQLEEAEQNLTQILEDHPESEPPAPPREEPEERPGSPIPSDYVPAEVSSRRRPLPFIEEEDEPASPDSEPPAEDVTENRNGFAGRNKHEEPEDEGPVPEPSAAERFWNGGGPHS